MQAPAPHRLVLLLALSLAPNACGIDSQLLGGGAEEEGGEWTRADNTAVDARIRTMRMRLPPGGAHAQARGHWPSWCEACARFWDLGC